MIDDFIEKMYNIIDDYEGKDVTEKQGWQLYEVLDSVWLKVRDYMSELKHQNVLIGFSLVVAEDGCPFT